MSKIWDQNEEINEDEELVVTDHRDASSAVIDAEEADDVETTQDDPREALAELGEDVASSPARRGHDNEVEK